jgi:hypothetical protein
MQRKATRYSSQNVLSGLIVCAECGANYQRITRSSGEVVWRCANRVEHGHGICRHSPSVTETAVIAFICNILDIKQFDPQIAKDSLEVISINSNGAMIPKLKPANTMMFLL